MHRLVLWKVFIMSMNGVYGYSYNPYAYNNAYSTNATSFQGGTTTNSTQEKKSSTLGTIAAVGAGIAAVGTAIYAVKKGKSINGADSSVWKNLTTGLSEIGKTIAEKVGKVFGKNKTNISDEIIENAKKIEEIRIPQSPEYMNQTLNNYINSVKNMANEAYEQATKPSYGLNFDYILGRK